MGDFTGGHAIQATSNSTDSLNALVGDLYPRWVLDGLVEAARAVSLDVVARPRLYVWNDIPETFFEFRVAYGTDVRYPDTRIRISQYDSNEQLIRLNLLEDEFSGRFDRLPDFFEFLCTKRLDWTECMRLKDLAYGLIAAADRAGSQEMRAEGLNYQGIAHDRLGELTAAASAYEAGLIAAAPDTRLWAKLSSNLGLVRVIAGLDSAQQPLEAAAAVFERYSDWADEMRTRLSLAEHFAVSGKFADAVVQARIALDRGRKVRKSFLRRELVDSVGAWQRRPDLGMVIGLGTAEVVRLLRNIPAEELFDADAIDIERQYRPDGQLHSVNSVEPQPLSPLGAINVHSRRSRPLALADSLELAKHI